MQALKNTLDRIKHQQDISQDIAQQIFKEPLPRATFQALSIVYNLALPAGQLANSPNKNIKTMEMLALAIGRLTKISSPCHFLATFQKELLYEFCQQPRHRQYQCLATKLFGMFPAVKINGEVPLLMKFDATMLDLDGTCEGSQMGNPNWQLTRSIFQQWLQAKRKQLSKETALCCQILLSSRRLLQESKEWPLWDSLWALLYLYLTQKFLEKPLTKNGGRATWCTMDGDELRSLMVILGEKVANEQERTLYNLVLFIIQQHLLEGGESGCFTQAANNYHSLVFSNWQHLLTLHLIKNGAKMLRQDRISQQTQSLITTVISNLHKSSVSPQFQYLLPHLLPQHKVRDYIRQRQLEFWNYGLDADVCEDIAKEYLKNIHSFEEEKRGQIICNLPLEYFVDELLGAQWSRSKKQEQKRKQHRQGKTIVRTIMKQHNRLGKRLHRYLQLSQESCEKDLKEFASQWDTYYSLHLEGINENNAKITIHFLTLDRSTLSQCFQIKARFPQQNTEIYCEILNALTDYLLTHKEASSVCSVLDLALEPIFVEYLQALSSSQRERLWSKWSQLMLQDDAMVRQLASLSP